MKNNKNQKTYEERKAFLLKMIGCQGSVITHEKAPLQDIFFAYTKFCGLPHKDFKKDLSCIWKEGLLGRIIASCGGTSRSEGLNPTYLYAYVGLKHDALVSKRKENPLFGTYQPKAKKKSEIRLLAHNPPSDELPRESFLFWDKGENKLLCVIGNFKEVKKEIKERVKFDLGVFIEASHSEMLDFSIKQNELPLTLFVINNNHHFSYIQKFNEYFLEAVKYCDYVLNLKEMVKRAVGEKPINF